MKKLIIYLPVILLLSTFSFQLIGQEKKTVTIGNPVTNTDENLKSNLVWDKNKTKTKAKKEVKMPDLGSQLWKNANFGWNNYKNDDYKWGNFWIGTGYGMNFINIEKAYWKVGLNLNWSKYTLYPTGQYGFTANNDYLKTTSLSVPIIAGYNVYQSIWTGFGVKVYTGPVFELLLGSKVNGYTENDHPTNNFQAGWTVGTDVRFLYILSARLAYSYYPYSLFQKDNLYRKALSFSVGL